MQFKYRDCRSPFCWLIWAQNREQGAKRLSIKPIRVSSPSPFESQVCLLRADCYLNSNARLAEAQVCGLWLLRSLAWKDFEKTCMNASLNSLIIQMSQQDCSGSNVYQCSSTHPKDDTLKKVPLKLLDKVWLCFRNYFFTEINKYSRCKADESVMATQKPSMFISADCRLCQ